MNGEVPLAERPRYRFQPVEVHPVVVLIAFNAGTHTDLIKMAFATFAKLVKPKSLLFSTRH
jgi:hypothetical protein